MIATPHSDFDLYGDAALLDPYPGYRMLRDLGSAVNLPHIDAHFIGRFDDVRAALTNWQVFSSDKGVGLNPVINEAWDEALICIDPPAHTPRRKLMTDVLGPPAIKFARDSIANRAYDLADRLAAKPQFDAVKDLAYDLPINLIMDLVGWPEDIRPSLLEYAEGSFDACGPMGPRVEKSLGKMQHMMGMIGDIFDANRVTPGGFASSLIDAANDGKITRDTSIGMLAGYVVAAFDTTINAISSAVWLFAENPGEWDKLRANPNLANDAATEIVRMECPLQYFCRYTTRDIEMSDGTTLPGDRRVIINYGSANRDERHFRDADTFIIDRDQKQHMGFGHGIHNCAGQGLARLELVAVLTALASKIKRFELVGLPERGVNNLVRGFRNIPMRAIAG
ncbi:MAG: cytochrome P450 [Sphingorhabdus sp.]